MRIRGSRSRPFANEHLFRHGFAPLVADIFIGKLEAVSLIEISCRHKAFERPKMDFLKAVMVAMIDRLQQKFLPEAQSAEFFRQDEPAKMGDVALKVFTVNAD